MALENGLLFLLERVGVLMEPRPPSARLLTLETLPLMLQPASGLRVAWGEAAMMAARYCSASMVVGRSLAWPVLLPCWPLMMLITPLWW